MDTKKLNNELLKRVDNESLTTWKTFFRNSFPTDEACLEFLYRAVSAEPSIDSWNYELKNYSIIMVDKNGNFLCDKILIPRRMLNTVNRLVSVASDMEKIRPGKDIFKIIFLVTCVETLQQLSGKTEPKKNYYLIFLKLTHLKRIKILFGTISNVMKPQPKMLSCNLSKY